MARAIGQQFNVFQPQILAPLIHDEGIIDRNTIDFIDARRAEIIIKPIIIGALFIAAGWREGSGQRKDRHRLASGFLCHVEAVGADGAAVAFDFDEFLQAACGQLVANFQHENLLVRLQK